MPQFYILVEATQWFKNGDHPLDYAERRQVIDHNGNLTSLSGDVCKERGWEGAIVRYFRHPEVPGTKVCEWCASPMHEHGWIDTRNGGHIVCPGDWIVSGDGGEYYPRKGKSLIELGEGT